MTCGHFVSSYSRRRLEDNPLHCCQASLVLHSQIDCEVDRVCEVVAGRWFFGLGQATDPTHGPRGWLGRSGSVRNGTLQLWISPQVLSIFIEPPTFNRCGPTGATSDGLDRYLCVQTRVGRSGRRKAGLATSGIGKLLMGVV